MNPYFLKWLKQKSNRAVTSIAFFPVITTLAFLILSWIMLEFDYSQTGKSMKAQWQWLRLKDATTARIIIATAAGGIISLTVFSFSMVMIVLNQAASQLSNRTLDQLIGNRFQQIVLGFYIGTIVYALFLLSTIRDIDSGVYVPALSTYLLIFLTVLDIFMFIYFLHYITQSVKYGTIIHRIYTQTSEALEKQCLNNMQPAPENTLRIGATVKAPASGVFQGFDRKVLLQICEQEDLVVSFIHPTGTFILKDTHLLVVINRDRVSLELEGKIRLALNIGREETINNNYFYGFRQLMEIAIKALSPGINDPGTAVLSLQALADLLAYRALHFPEQEIKDAVGRVRILPCEKSFEEIFSLSILPIWDYGKNDRLILQTLYLLLRQLQPYNQSQTLQKLLEGVKSAVALHAL